MKSKDKSSEQRFDHVIATNRNSYLNIILLNYYCYTIIEKR